MLSKIFAPGPLHQAVIDGDKDGDFRDAHETLVRASHNTKIDIAQHREGWVLINGARCYVTYTSDGEAAIHDDPKGLVDYGVAIAMPFGDKEAKLIERVNLTINELPANEDPEVTINARLRLDLPAVIPETAADQLIGKPLWDLTECKGPLAQIAAMTILHARCDRGNDRTIVMLDVSKWACQLHEAHLKWEQGRPAVRAMRAKGVSVAA